MSETLKEAAEKFRRSNRGNPYLTINKVFELGSQWQKDRIVEVLKERAFYTKWGYIQKLIKLIGEMP